jgi:predicted metal-dependent enzyme (double-stranded beta helix superfamily)
VRRLHDPIPDRHVADPQWAEEVGVRGHGDLLRDGTRPLDYASGMVQDEFVLDTVAVRAFISDVRAAIDRASSPAEACDAIRPRFADLLADREWLPDRYQEAAVESGMGGGIGQWLLYRAGDGLLSLFSLVVPPDAQTPVHDHLAWGLVGLYRGTQEEEVYANGDGGALELVERRALLPGDFYALIPPRDDIHRVRTTSTVTSVSIHLLTNDTGCVWRHAYDPASGEQKPFRSGYVNAPCERAAALRESDI